MFQNTDVLFYFTQLTCIFYILVFFWFLKSLINPSIPLTSQFNNKHSLKYLKRQLRADNMYVLKNFNSVNYINMFKSSFLKFNLYYCVLQIAFS